MLIHLCKCRKFYSRLYLVQKGVTALNNGHQNDRQNHVEH